MGEAVHAHGPFCGPSVTWKNLFDGRENGSMGVTIRVVAENPSAPIENHEDPFEEDICRPARNAHGDS